MAPSSAFVSDDLLTEFLSLLPVKSLLRFKCVSHSWNNLISDSNFVKFHFKKSKSQNPHFTLVTHHVNDHKYEVDYSVIPYSISSFVDNPSFTLFTDHHYLLNKKDCCRMVGSCNGLICLAGFSFLRATSSNYYHEYEYWVRYWNPTTRAISEKIGCFIGSRGFNFNFGCDNSTGTFKVVASRSIPQTSDVRVLSFGDSVWRNIQSFPYVPLNLDQEVFGHNAVFLNGTLNWLAIHYTKWDSWYMRQKYLTVEHLIIVSLDLGTETYNIYTLPRGFADQLPPEEPILRVLGDYLCFSYYGYNQADIIIWQMKKFGVEESWTQFLKISFHDLQLNCDFSNKTQKYHFNIRPLFLSKDGDTLVLHNIVENQAILYNWRDRRVKKSGVSVHKTVIDDGTYNKLFWDDAIIFVESLISICSN